VVSHEVGIDEAEVAYEKFDKRIDGYTSKFLVFFSPPKFSLPACLGVCLGLWREGERRKERE
jgi:hypothetical protein